jgi:hypothetical protein
MPLESDDAVRLDRPNVRPVASVSSGRGFARAASSAGIGTMTRNQVIVVSAMLPIVLVIIGVFEGRASRESFSGQTHP